MNTFQIGMKVSETQAEGPGKRFSFWVQGCHFNCPGCCNQEFLPFSGGETISVQTLVDEVLKSKDEKGIEGVSILGGEPFTQINPLEEFVREMKANNLTVMIYTGFRLEELQKMGNEKVKSILLNTDILVDGRYNQKLPDNERRWIGSTNQKMIFLSDKYSPSDPCFSQKETVEFRLVNGQLYINGWPDKRLPIINEEKS